MRIKFIVNPTAGKGKAQIARTMIEEKLENYNDHSFSFEETSCPGDATRITREAIAKQYDIVVSVGGDGTVNEIIQGLVGSDIKLGIIPAGSGNDLAKSVGIPKDIHSALSLVLASNVQEIDVGRVNEQYFINVAGIGFDVEVLNQLESIRKFFSGTLAYVLSVLKTLISYKFKNVTLILDDQQIEREILLVAIGNGRYYGGGMMITPSALVDDGYFDICIINKLSKLRILKLFPTIFKGTHIHEPEVECFRAKRVKIVSEDIAINCDGEIIGNTPISFSIADFKLNLITNKEATCDDRKKSQWITEPR